MRKTIIKSLSLMVVLISFTSCVQQLETTEELVPLPEFNPNVTITSTPILTTSANAKYTYQFSILNKTP